MGGGSPPTANPCEKEEQARGRQQHKQIQEAKDKGEADGRQASGEPHFPPHATPQSLGFGPDLPPTTRVAEDEPICDLQESHSVTVPSESMKPSGTAVT